MEVTQSPTTTKGRPRMVYDKEASMAQAQDKATLIQAIAGQVVIYQKPRIQRPRRVGHA